MNHTTYLLLAFCFLIACNENEQTTDTQTTTAVSKPVLTETENSTTKEIEKPNIPNKERPVSSSLDKELDISDCIGIYSKGSHNESWLLSIREYDGHAQALLMHFEGMLPPVDMLLQDSDMIQGLTSQEFALDINPKEKTFTYKGGDGIIDGTKVVFNGETEYVNNNLILERDASYSALMEDK